MSFRERKKQSFIYTYSFLNKKIMVQPVSYKRFFGLTIAFYFQGTLSIYKYNWSTGLVDPPPTDGNRLYNTRVMLKEFMYEKTDLEEAEMKR